METSRTCVAFTWRSPASDPRDFQHSIYVGALTYLIMIARMKNELPRDEMETSMTHKGTVAVRARIFYSQLRFYRSPH